MQLKMLGPTNGSQNAWRCCSSSKSIIKMMLTLSPKVDKLYPYCASWSHFGDRADTGRGDIFGNFMRPYLTGG